MSFPLKSSLFSVLLLGGGFASQAEAVPSCSPSLRVNAPHYPGAESIPTGNNLMLPAGKSVAVEGQQLIFTGRVLDSRCAPVREAVVELWQTDPFGKWFLAQSADLATPNPVFAGAGRAITDGYGQFIFITAFPGAVLERKAKGTAVHAPQLNIRVRAESFDPFSTALFFENDKRNASDPVYRTLNAATREDATIHMGQDAQGNLTGQVDIILNGRAPYQTY